MDVITRVQWDSRYAAGFGPAPTADEVWLHHSVTIAPDLIPPFTDEYAAMRSLEAIGQQRFGAGISYSFAVMPNGRVYQGTGPGRVGSHTGGRNTRSRGIVLVGNYDTTTPTLAMVEAVAALLRFGEGRAGYWREAQLTGGHRDAPGAQTACPGRKAYALIPTINTLAASPPEDDVTPDELVSAARTAISQMFDEAANRSTPTGKSFGNDLAVILSGAQPAPLDPVKFAAELAPHLGDAVNLATVEAGVRNVLGSLSNPEAPDA